MPPPKKIDMEMSESSDKLMKLTKTIPHDLVEHIISTFLPIQSLLRNRVVSKRFENTKIKSLNLDFSGIYSRRRRQLEVVGIIEKVFNLHKGSKIHRFVLSISHIGVEDKLYCWITMCIRKHIKELVLDFSKSKRVLDIPIDFSAIETLQILELRWCKFVLPENSLKGLKLLKTLLLMRTEMTKAMIDAIFSNCIYLESLELIECGMTGTRMLSIHAPNHKKFKSLVVSSMRGIWHILIDAPTLEYYKYDGYVISVNFLTTDALKEANLHYARNFTRRLYDSSHLVNTNMRFYARVYVLATSTIFLEALTKRSLGGRVESRSTCKFENLTEFKIFFKAPTFCNLFDIAEFLKGCPNLKQVLIDIQNFTFESRMYFWEMHHKQEIKNNNYRMEFLKEVKIIGYKGHSHELDIVEFFVKNAPSLEKLELAMPKNAEDNAHTPDYGRINFIKSIYPRVYVTEV